YSTLYAHLNSVAITQVPCDGRTNIEGGDVHYNGKTYSRSFINRGNPVGKVGKTGTTFYHLHFEVAKNKTGGYEMHLKNRVDPFVIYNVAKFYPPTGSCASPLPSEFLWIAC